ncbi:complement factor H isoform X2 [Ahaetulla prasina]|uniref:complement factor H isoform X2 n=1 Tax=Ahaetulla prasina TaxID=499056 RepID=UPI00264A2B19|nr:complement factor H isoform X2 [Ahaetulla prasina]
MKKKLKVGYSLEQSEEAKSKRGFERNLESLAVTGQKCPGPGSGMTFHFLGYTVLVLLLACFTAVAAENACGPPARREREQPMEELTAETYVHGHTISYKCRPGYAKAWPIKLECNDGVWQRLPPTKNCTGISCGSPGDSDYANFELTQGEDFTFGARVVYTCIEGYKMLSQYNYRDCRANGWTNEVPHCEINKCLPITIPRNVRIIQGAKSQMNEDFLSGDLVIFGCFGNLKIKGSNKITCTADGTWSAPVPECIEITCQADNIENGNILSPKVIYKEGERIRFSCNEGYVYVDRPDALCTETGWGTKLQCEEIKCFPPEVMNGYIQPRQDQYTYNDEIQTICNEGFVFGGPGKVSKCIAIGWSPPPFCKRKGCDYIRIENGRMENHYEYYRPFPKWQGETIRFSCYHGFLPKSKEIWQTATCNNSRFEPEPKCFKMCDPSLRFHYGYFITYYWHTYIEGDEITFACAQGFSPANQQSTVTCTKNGWSPAPSCIPAVEPTCKNVYLSHGNFESQQQSFQINAKAKYNCYDGYTTSKGETEAETQCLTKGWSPKPECIKTCLKPPEGDFIFNTTKSVFFPGDKLHYECKEGFEITKNTIDDTIACTDKGWEPTPSCVSIVCKTPFLENGTIEPREDIFLHKMVVYFKCNEGFTIVGSESAQCYHFGWSPQPPICKENVKPCPASPIISNGIVTDEPKAIFQHGDILEVQCESSFVLYGSKIIKCVDGEWAPLPSCAKEEKTCGQPPTIKNGYTFDVKSLYSHGDTLEYRCVQRYTIIGTNPAKCLHGQWEVPSCLVNPRSCTRPQYAVFQPAVLTTKQFKTYQVAHYRCGSNLHQTNCVNGLWLPEPRCEGTCPPPPQLPNAIDVAEMRIHRSREEVSFMCQEHFFLRGPQKIKCEDGKWQTPPRCLDLRCKSPPEIDNGIIEIGNRTMFYHGEIVEYRCSSGFEISQLNTVRCENMKWSKLPVCKERSCGPAPEIPNASLEQEGREQYDSGKIINYTCNHGFDTKESTKITCRRGQWVGAFTCKDATCPSPPIVENAEITGDTMKKYINGEKINYRCNDGFEISGSAAVTCRQNNWSRLPRCVDVRCSSPPEIQNGQIIGEIKETYLPREKVQYRCNTGYGLLGSTFITCLKNGWTQIPRCTDIEGKCGRPPHVANGDITDLPKPVYLHSESVTYQCQNFYTMQGSPRVTCQNGRWSQTPTCRVACTASEEDMREHNIRLKWTNGDKIYSEDGNTVEFVCLRGYKRHPNTRSLRVSCVDGKFEYPLCIRS